MKNIKIFSIALVLVTVSLSCKKTYLDTTPSQNIDQEKAIVDLATTRAAVMGLYSVMQSTDYYGRSLLLIPDLMTDNVVQSRQAGTRYTNYDKRTVSSSDGYANDIWANAYKIIVNANTVINKATTLTVPSKDSVEMRQVIGEAYALRAFAYFDLSRFFSMPPNFTVDQSHLGVPIVLSSFPSGISNISYPSRNTVAEVYARIIADLNTSLTYLPASGDVYFNGAINTSLFKVRMNKWSVYALLARTNLYKEDWPAAEAAATIVINSAKYSLLPAASIINDFHVPMNAESIFELANNSFDNAGADGIAYIYSQAGYGEMLATNDLYTGYNSTDTRRPFMVLGNRAAAGGETNVPLVNKYNNITTYEENIKLFRLSELYLIRSEARAKIGGTSFAGGQADLQVIVTSRNSSSLTVVSTNTTLTSMMSRILSERRRELAFEGHRLFDLTRTKTSYSKYKSDGTVVSGISATSFRGILPIPVSETRANSNLVQNTGY